MIAALPVSGGALPGVEWVLLSLGLLGSSLLDRFREEDDSDGGGDLLDDGGSGGNGGLDGLGDDGGGDGLDDLGGGGDDGLGDLGDVGGMDDGDPFGEDDGDDRTTELANRVDELEGEVANLSSTVNTVRSENEEISEQVDDIAEDVRNLLDIYEMVTRGINPFVDEGAGMGGEAADASFGLFDEAGQDEETEELDDDIADADAEGFFDEELAEEDPIEEPDEDAFDTSEEDETDEEDPFDAEFDEDPLEEDLDAEFEDADAEFEDADEEFEDFDTEFDEEESLDEDDTEQEDTMGDSGKSFSELKDEYESGEADWAEEEAEPAENGMDSATELGGEELPDASGEDEADSTSVGEPEMPGADSHAAETAHAGGRADAGGETSSPIEADNGSPIEADNSEFEFVGGEAGPAQHRDKPYLTSLPGDYVGDLLVMEWLEYLVEESDTTDAVRAVNYYERVEWVSPEVAEQLKSFLSGFGEIDRNLIDEPGTATLALRHHTQSLKYITQLSSATAESVVMDRWPQLSEGTYGAER